MDEIDIGPVGAADLDDDIVKASPANYPLDG